MNPHLPGWILTEKLQRLRSEISRRALSRLPATDISRRRRIPYEPDPSADQGHISDAEYWEIQRDIVNREFPKYA